METRDNRDKVRNDPADLDGPMVVAIQLRLEVSADPQRLLNAYYDEVMDTIHESQNVREGKDLFVVRQSMNAWRSTQSKLLNATSISESLRLLSCRSGVVFFSWPVMWVSSIRGNPSTLIRTHMWCVRIFSCGHDDHFYILSVKNKGIGLVSKERMREMAYETIIEPLQRHGVSPLQHPSSSYLRR